MLVQNWVDILLSSLQGLSLEVVSFVPSLLGAVVVVIVGLIVAVGLEKLVERIIYHLKLDTLLRKLGVEMYLNRANLELNAGHFIGKFVYWFILLAFALAASDILGFNALSRFIGDVLFYIPNVIVAALIMIVTLIASHFVRGLVRASVLGVRVHGGKFLVSIAWWVVFVFGSLVALAQLGVANTIIETFVAGLIAMFALAGGLAFGLGGKDTAGKILERLRGDWEHH